MTTHRMAFGGAALALIVGFAAAAFAGGPGAPPTESEHGSQVSATANATAGVNAHGDLEALKRKIEEQGAKVSAVAREKAEHDIGESQKQVDASAAVDGDARVAARLGEEFGLSADALLAEKTALNASWGELMVAHSIAANAGTDVTIEQLMTLKQDGMGWGKIAAGLDLQLGSVVSGVKTEAKVARGIARADGRVAPMSGPGARVGLGAGAGVGAGATRGKSATHIGVGAGVGAGVKNKP